MISTSRKKVISKQYFFFWTEKYVFTSWDEELIEKYLRQWKKLVSTSKNKICLSEMVSTHISDGFG